MYALISNIDMLFQKEQRQCLLLISAGAMLSAYSYLFAFSLFLLCKFLIKLHYDYESVANIYG